MSDQSGSGTGREEVPRTDLCEDCEREIVPELVRVEGQHELIQQAREADEGFMPITAGSATVRYSCRCGSVEVEFEPGTASAWDIPDGWLWEGELCSSGTDTEQEGDR